MIRPHRKAHVKFRKDNPIFYEQIPVLLPRLESIEKNVYKPCTYCNYDPKSDDKYQELVERLSGGSGSNKAQKANTNGGNKGDSDKVEIQICLKTESDTIRYDTIL